MSAIALRTSHAEAHLKVSSRHHYCGPPSLGPWACALAFVDGGQLPGWAQLAGGHSLATHRCRTAIRAVLPALGVGPGSEVLAPAFNCGTEIDAILACGASVKLYDVTPDARITVEAVTSGLTSATRAVYVTHYFGWPQDLDPIRELCDERNLVLLEDCALALFSRDGRGWLGRWGDASFYSLTKTLGVPDGGIAALRSPLDLRFSRSRARTVASECAGLVRRAFIRALASSPLGAPEILSRGRHHASACFVAQRSRIDAAGVPLRSHHCG